MASYRKNIAVGATMIVALVLLGLMILIFGEAPVRLIRGAQIWVTFHADSAEGMSKGSPIFYLGLNVGQVRDVALRENEPGVLLQGTIEAGSPVPANVEGVIKTTLIGGSASLSLEPVGTPTGRIKQGTNIHVRAGGNNVLPKEFAELASEMKELASRLKVTVDDWNNSKVINKVVSTLDGVSKTVGKFGETSDELKKFISDDKMRGDLRETLANFKTVSENAKTIMKNVEKLSADLAKTNADVSVVISKTGGHVDDLSKQIGGRLDQLAGIFDKFQSVAEKIDKGNGTAGKLINDPKLYEALLETSQELSLTVKDLRRLVEQWEQEGVSVKLGGKK